MEYTANEIIGLNKTLTGERGQQDTRWEGLARMFHPGYQGFISGHASGEQLTEQIYDGIGREASKRLAAFIFTNLTGGHTRWFRLKFRQEDLNDQKPAAAWLEEVTKRMHQAIQESNFKSSGNEFMRCLPVFGTASEQAMERIDPTIPDDEFKGLVFKNLHLENVVGLEDANGEVTTTFCAYEWTAKQAVDYFGEDNLCGDILDAYANTPSKKFPFIHAVYPRYEDFNEFAVVLRVGPYSVPADRKPWASVHVCCTEKKIIKESGFNSMPRSVARWAKAPAWEDIWGYGLGDDSQPDVQTINEAIRLEFESWEKTIDPPMKTTQNNIIGDLQNVRGGLTTVVDINNLVPLVEGTDWQVTIIKREEQAQNVRDVWLTDKIFLPDQETGDMTAFEFGKRLQEMQKLLGATLGNIESEHMDWVVERSFDLMNNKNAFPALPEGLEKAELDVEYVGPLALAQRVEETQTASAWVAFIMSIIEAYPQAIDIPDWDQMIQDVGKELGVSEEWINSQPEVQAVRKRREQAIEAAARAEQAGKMGSAVRDLSEARQTARG